MSKELERLKNEGYFDVDGFKAWLEKEFPGPMQYPFTRGLIDSILNDAAEEWNYEDGSFLTRLTDMIPELTWEDVIPFADALMLGTPS